MNLIKALKPLLTGFITIFLFGLASAASADEILIIVHENGPLANISDKDIQEIYLGEKRFAGDIKIIPIEPKDYEVRDIFLSSLMRMNAKDFRIHWIKKVFQEGIEPPLLKESMQDIIDKVKSEVGAIGYVSKKAVKDEQGIKIIRTIK